MKRFLCHVLMLACWLVAAPARAETTSAADYFNLGSATYIREDAERALAIVNEGLLFHPDDEPLLKLKALLEQKQQEQNQQQQQQPQQDQQDESGNQDQSDQREQTPDNTDQNKPEDQPPPEPETQDEQESRESEAGEMTEEEAEMVLDSLRQLEQAQREELMQEMIRRQMQNMPPVEKDW